MKEEKRYMYPTDLKYEWSVDRVNVVAPSEDNENPEPIWADIPCLILSWECAMDEMDYRENYQTAYRTAIYRDGKCLWESGKTEGYEQNCKVQNPPIYQDDDMTDTFWTVTLWDMEFQLTDTGSGNFE